MITILSIIVTYLFFKYALKYIQDHDADYENPNIDQFGDSE